MNKRVIKLLNYLEVNHDVEVKEGLFLDNNTYIIDNKEYLVLTDAEADKTFEDYMEAFIDDLGIEGFTEMGRDYIINNCIDKTWFNEAMRESNEFYIEDIRVESSSIDKFENRLEEEMAEANCDDEESYLDYLCSQYEDGVEWFKFNFGDKEFYETAKEKCDLDMAKISEYCIEVDGRGSALASYDGEEIELGDNYYAYRLN